MIERFPISKKREYFWLLEFLMNYSDYDFYYTKNNTRIYITDTKTLQYLIKCSSTVYMKKEHGDYIGCILVWKSKGGGLTRNYVKIASKDAKVAKELLTVLLWNYSKELYIKIRKDSKFLRVFKEKGFKFAGARGVQILLHRKPVIYKKVIKEA